MGTYMQSISDFEPDTQKLRNEVAIHNRIVDGVYALKKQQHDEDLREIANCECALVIVFLPIFVIWITYIISNA